MNPNTHRRVFCTGSGSGPDRVGFEPDWGGSLIKIAIDPHTGVTGTAAWSAAAQLAVQLQITGTDPQPWYSMRKIVTMNESGVPVPFLFANLGANQRDSLAPGKPAARQQLILEFLRGNRAKEGAKLGQLRVRPSALGDIVHALPVTFLPSRIAEIAGSPTVPISETNPARRLASGTMLLIVASL